MPEYKVKLKNHQHGGHGDYLSCHGTVDTDSRSGDSTFVHVNCEHYGDTWCFEPVEGKVCTYKIRLANLSNGACGCYLSAHRTVDGDARSGDSTYVNANENDCGDEWTLVPVLEEGPNAFQIHLTKSDYGAIGSILSAHRTVSGDVLSDERGDDSTYVNVNDSYDGCYWKLKEA